ncbi:MAG: hypothetical protein JWP03_741 [Phycisphaerales bacterium]|nr:hypothetical protein [Phycisphaerales bacterium]
MIREMASPLDGYSLKARYLPALIVMLPLWLAFAVWFPPDKQFLGVFASAGVTLVLSTLLAQLGRDAGKARQKALFVEWGGPPSMRALSYQTGIVNPVTLARCHAALRTLVPTLELPENELAEKDNWDSAKKNYESASDYLREATRDKATFRLVYAENVNYGFRRNLWAMKPGGIGTCLIALPAVIAHASMRDLAKEGLTGIDAASALLAVVLFTFWCLRFTKSWVKISADEYSSRLIASAEVLATKSSKTAKE